MRLWRESEIRAQRLAAIAAAFERMTLAELESVRRQTLLMERRALRNFTILLNRLSNGTLYPLLAIALLLVVGAAILPAIIAASLGVVTAHAIYPLIKTRCARARPFDRDESIASLLAPLDKHSFPSGHVMTATAAFLPLTVALPALLPAAVILVILIGWVRIAAGHHYPSDLAAGILLGSVISAPAAIWMLY